MFGNKKAPKLVWIENKNWINSKPLPWEQLRGHLVLLDFWTYSCVNCLRTLPALKSMWEKYKDKGLLIIGVHTPEFDFEKDLFNVQKAARKHNLTYPILNDPERINWENYGNTYWPRAALINTEGEVIMDHVGEAGYDEIEEEIIAELKSMKKLSAAQTTKEQRRFYPSGISPETYGGSTRNQGLGSAKVCTKDGCDEYYDSGKHHPNTIYLQGDWKQTSEYVEFKGDKGHILFSYSAKEVNVVLDGKGAATVLLDDQPIVTENTGSDVQTKSGKSLVFIDGPDMYTVVKKKDFHSAVLKIIPFKGMRVYAYTFG